MGKNGTSIISYGRVPAEFKDQLGAILVFRLGLARLGTGNIVCLDQRGASSIILNNQPSADRGALCFQFATLA